MVVTISVKFDENTLHSFQDTKQTQVYHQNHYLHCSKGHNSQSR